MKKLGNLLVLILVFLLVYSCENTSDLNYQDQIIIGSSFTSADTTIISNIGTKFIANSPLYVRVTTKNEYKDKALVLKIQKVGSTNNAFGEKKWFQGPTYHAATFYVPELSVGNYNLFLLEDGETTPLATKTLEIY